jgi:hypothetical protein
MDFIPGTYRTQSGTEAYVTDRHHQILLWGWMLKEDYPKGCTQQC